MSTQWRRTWWSPRRWSGAHVGLRSIRSAALGVAIDEAVARIGGLDVLMTNAAAMLFGEFHEQRRIVSPDFGRVGDRHSTGSEWHGSQDRSRRGRPEVRQRRSAHTRGHRPAVRAALIGNQHARAELRNAATAARKAYRRGSEKEARRAAQSLTRAVQIAGAQRKSREAPRAPQSPSPRQQARGVAVAAKKKAHSAPDRKHLRWAPPRRPLAPDDRRRRLNGTSRSVPVI